MAGASRFLLLLCGVSLLAGCAGDTPRVGAGVAGPACLDDSQRCISMRQGRLKQLQSDPNRAWVFRAEPHDHYATGVKLFAYSTARSRMTCRELAHGAGETRSARTWLRRPQPGITSEQLLRVRMLNDEVAGQLNKALKRKCPGRRVG